MSTQGELALQIDDIRRELLRLVSEARACDEQIKLIVHRQTDLRSSIIMTLDSLDVIEGKLRGIRKAAPAKVPDDRSGP